MRSLWTFFAAALLGCIHYASADETAPAYKACYDNPGSLKQKGTSDFLSEGSCRKICVDQDKANGGLGFSVMGLTTETKCFCGQKMPNKAHKVDASNCNFSCPGFPENKCGSRDGSYIAVYITGLEANPMVDDKPMTTSSSQTTDSSTTSVVVSITPTSTTQKDGGSGGSVNKGAVAAGVVVGVLLVLALGGGGFLYIRNRNRQQVEEEYRRSAAAREFAQKPSSDHRLDPGMVQRRDSVGSIADNQDYSRRILKVTNPDG